MPAASEVGARLRALTIAATLIDLAMPGRAPAQSAQPSAGGNNPAQARTMRGVPSGQQAGTTEEGGWPKISFDTVASVDYAGMSSRTGPDRGPGLVFWSDSTLLVEVDDKLSLAGLFQFKPRQPLSPGNPNRDLFINRGLNRKEGGKMKELYVRYGDWRVGKFVQDFGRAYALLPGPWASDFIEEPEEGYEPSDMIGIEKIHVYGNEESGWRQLSLSAFMVDRTFLHQSFPFNEGMVHYKDGGVGNTRWPENFMATYDVLNMPLGRWGQMSYQASAIRWGKTYKAQRGEWWMTLGGDLTVPLHGTVADTLSSRYSQLRFYLEAARRENFEGVAGRSRDYLSASAEYLTGPWTADLTTSQRRTADKVEPTRRDASYTASLAYTLPSQTIVALSAAREKVGAAKGVYAGLRLTQTITLCSRCIARGRYY